MFLCALQHTLRSNVFAQETVTDCHRYAASEVAGLAVSLAADESSYITRKQYLIEGGTRFSFVLTRKRPSIEYRA
jgi:hypothetical protein